jgi:hypothetical protein
MAPTFGSAFTLSLGALFSKAFLRLTTKSYTVQGREILVDALRIRKSREEYQRRPGIVTGESIMRATADLCSMQSQLSGR